MVKIMENPIPLVGDLGGKPIILGNPINMFQKRTTSETGAGGLDVVAVPPKPKVS